LKVETKDLEDRQVEITVEVPQDRVQKAMQVAARKLSRRVKIPGFRPGKAPYAVVLRKIGEEQVFEEALDSLGQDIYQSALDDAEIEPYAPGALEEIVSRDPLVLRYSVPLAPEVDLGAYRDLRLDYEPSEVKDESVEDVMQDLRQGQALIEPVDRAAEMNDVVVLDVEGELHDEGASDEQRLLSEKNVSVLVEDETDWPVPGVAQHLLGMAAGDEKSFGYTFPDDYPTEDLRGKSASFHLNCLDVKSRIVPEWSDDLAKTMGDFESLEDLRVKVREQLKSQLDQQTDSDYAQEVIEKAVEGASVTYPPVLIDREIDDMLHDLGHQLERQKLTLEDYLKGEDKTLEELRDELKPRAEKRLKRALVLGKVVDDESLKVGENEIDASLDRIVAPLEGRSQELRKRLDTPAGRRSVALDLLTDKAVGRLVAIAKGEAPELGADGAKADDQAPESASQTAGEAAADEDLDIESAQHPPEKNEAEAQPAAEVEPASEIDEEPAPSEE
jgi:trigger factor